jgi:hypothetical protein
MNLARLFLTTALSLCALPASVHAQDAACLLQGDFQIAGQRVLISDCVENKTLPEAEFREVCAGMSQFTLAGETYQATVNFSATCPPDPQGSCEGIFDGAITARYYNRDEQLLKDSRETCKAQQGTWR